MTSTETVERNYAEEVLVLVKQLDEMHLLKWIKLGGAYSTVIDSSGHEDGRFFAIRCDDESFCVNYCGKHMLFQDQGRMFKHRSMAPEYEGPEYSRDAMDYFDLWFYRTGESLPSSDEATIQAK